MTGCVQIELDDFTLNVKALEQEFVRGEEQFGEMLDALVVRHQERACSVSPACSQRAYSTPTACSQHVHSVPIVSLQHALSVPALSPQHACNMLAASSDQRL